MIYPHNLKYYWISFDLHYQIKVAQQFSGRFEKLKIFSEIMLNFNTHAKFLLGKTG